MSQRMHGSILILGLLLATACGSDDGGGNEGTGSGGKSGSSGKGGSSGSSGSGTGGSSASGGGGSGGSAIPPTNQPGDCGLENPAFCETFETRHEGGRAGPLDESKWSLARWGHTITQFFTRLPADSQSNRVFPSTFCGEPFSGLVPYNDVELCPGVGVDGTMSNQLNEVFDDATGFGFNSMRIRQAIDFADAPATIVFDVDAKINPHNVGHGWWIELFVTEDPAPMPYHGAPTVLSYPRNGLGFAFQGFSGCPKNAQLWGNELNRVFVTRDHEIIRDNDDFDIDSGSDHCFTTADGQLNRFRFVISQNEAEVWVSDHDAPTELRRVGIARDLGLNFTRGYVHIQHAQYNANKDGNVTSAQTYRWDNVGFSGPTFATPRAYEVEDNDGEDNEGLGGRVFGYNLSANSARALTVSGVDLNGATRGLFNFNIFCPAPTTLEYRFNGGEWHTFEVPELGESDPLLRTFTVDAPLAELVNGENTIELRADEASVGNLELTLEVGE